MLSEDGQKIGLYFGNLELDFSPILLSGKIFTNYNFKINFLVTTVSKNALSPDLRETLEQFTIPLVTFGNAQIDLPTFRQLKYSFDDYNQLLTAIFNFYYCKLFYL
jgi:hypothetical protein